MGPPSYMRSVVNRNFVMRRIPVLDQEWEQCDNQLVTYTAKVAVYSEIRTKQSTQREHHVGLLNFNPGGTYRNR